MSSIPTLPGIRSQMVATDRLQTHVLSCGPDDGTAVLFIHGNVSSATFWEETMLALPAGFRAIAPDIRGYGESQALPLDATVGLDDVAEDIHSLAQTLGLAHYHMVGHSLGGNVAMKYALKYPATLLSLTLVATGSPYGFGGTKGVDGQPVADDGAPAGGGGANPEFVRLLAEKYREADNPTAPINVMRQFYFKPPFTPVREQELLSSMLAIQTGPEFYPGDFVASANWPGMAPGTKGPLNALAGKHYNASGLAHIDPKPPILWIRGEVDQIVANGSLFDLATLGSLGAVPGWPGAEICPPQPMIDQTRAVLEAYAAEGGRYREVVLADAGHTPYIEKPEEFNEAFHALLMGG